MKKRILSILLTLCLVLMLCPVTALADEPPCIRGDIDLDGEVTVKDATLLQNYLEGLRTFTDEELKVADYNGDGSVDYRDWIGLQSYFESHVDPHLQRNIFCRQKSFPLTSSEAWFPMTRTIRKSPKKRLTFCSTQQTSVWIL